MPSMTSRANPKAVVTGDPGGHRRDVHALGRCGVQERLGRRGVDAAPALAHRQPLHAEQPGRLAQDGRVEFFALERCEGGRVGRFPTMTP